MAKKRPILVQIWKDPDFQKFTISEKLIFVCLFTNEDTTESGVYELTFETISYLTGVPVETVKTTILEKFRQKITYDSKNSIIFVKNFLTHNGTGNPRNLIQSILNDYQDTNKSLVWNEFWEYNGSRVEKIIQGCSTLKTDIKKGKVVFPEVFSNSCVTVNQLLGNSSLTVAQ